MLMKCFSMSQNDRFRSHRKAKVVASVPACPGVCAGERFLLPRFGAREAGPNVTPTLCRQHLKVLNTSARHERHPREVGTKKRRTALRSVMSSAAQYRRDEKCGLAPGTLVLDRWLNR
jgi:hypothetical protein